MSKKTTIKDVAKLAGVSTASVSQVLNGNANSFHKDTVARIIAAKESLNYTPNYFAQKMTKKSSQMIGVLVPDISNPFFSTLVSGIEDVLYKNGYITILSNVGFEAEKEKKHIEEFGRREVDGFVVASSATSKVEAAAQLNKEGKPYVLLDHETVYANGDAISVDSYGGGELAGRHLQELGHRDVVIVAPVNPSATIQNRISGFLRVFPNCKNDIIYTDLSPEGGRIAAAEVVKTAATAIFAINDELAIGLSSGLSELGKSVPADYSLIGYDNIAMGNYIKPKLTTIAQPITELGERTASMLLSRIANPTKDPEHIILPVKLIKKDSTAPLN
ncbi:ribose utilization transcriptional repressor RbsR [Vagococcus coleopterorum]|nr:LacI family DNA-binding transcriptional regulator [Vagococcus coleopterorum]